jgi:hypothetical protein
LFGLLGLFESRAVLIDCGVVATAVDAGGFFFFFTAVC